MSLVSYFAAPNRLCVTVKHKRDEQIHWKTSRLLTQNAEQMENRTCVAAVMGIHVTKESRVQERTAMALENVEGLKEILQRIHDNSAHALNRSEALERMLRKHPDLWKEYQEALNAVEAQCVHQDFGSLLDRVR
jgi:hypothetical protein